MYNFFHMVAENHFGILKKIKIKTPSKTSFLQPLLIMEVEKLDIQNNQWQLKRTLQLLT